MNSAPTLFWLLTAVATGSLLLAIFTDMQGKKRATWVLLACCTAALVGVGGMLFLAEPI